MKTEVCGNIEIGVALFGNFILKMIETLGFSLTTQWYSEWEFDGDTGRTSHFVNSYFGIASVLSVLIGLVFGCIAD